MKTLILLTAITLAANAQDLALVEAAVEWRYVATVKDGDEKRDLYAKMPLGGTKQMPTVTLKAWGGPESKISLDCKKQMVRANDEKWVKAPPKSLGAILLKFACKR